MASDLFTRRQTHFALWAPGQAGPRLSIGSFAFGTPPTLQAERTLPMLPAVDVQDLWVIAAADCGLNDGQVYHYWFEVEDTDPANQSSNTISVTDPLSSTVDWRLTRTDGDQPASVILFEGGSLFACDLDGKQLTPPASPDLRNLATNNFTVIYELPTAWARKPRGGTTERAVGTFRDVIAMLQADAPAANFVDLEVAAVGRAHIAELGINAIELLPPADSYYEREWGYGTAHLCAPDFELGQPGFYSWSTANTDLRALADVCHLLHIRLIDDVVMGFGRTDPYERIAFNDFHIEFDVRNPPLDPDAWTSRPNQPRQSFGGTLWRYVREINTYDPVNGGMETFAPARHLHFLAQERWMNDFAIDGFRIDSVETVANWDFLGAFTDRARTLFRMRFALQGLLDNDADARFLVVGEELTLPLDILLQGRITSLWNDKFRQYLRSALLGQSANGEDFESTVKKMVDCRLFGFSDCAQAVNYIGSHDVEGLHQERIATMFRYQFPIDSSMTDEQRAAQNHQIELRVKLAFACLLTAVGIPMILAGDEFADENDLFDIHGNVTNDSGKQLDPVNYTRLEGDENAWRLNVLANVRRLIALRTSHPALGVNDTTWLHIDFTPGRRVLVWQRGSNDNPVIVVANFSEFVSTATPGSEAEYVVPNWPGQHDFAWHEFSLGQDITPDWIGREPLSAWEAKVYAHR